MKHHIVVTLSLFALSTALGAAIPRPPAQILCTPDRHSRFDLDNFDLDGANTHLFEYGGKVTMTKTPDKELPSYVKEGYSFKYGTGVDFYTVKEKSPYSKDFVDAHDSLLFVTYRGTVDGDGRLTLMGAQHESFFHMDLVKHRYYGYVSTYGAVDAYTGTCTILKR